MVGMPWIANCVAGQRNGEPLVRAFMAGRGRCLQRPTLVIVSSLDPSPAPSKVKWLAGCLWVPLLLMILLFVIGKMCSSVGSMPLPKERMAKTEIRLLAEMVRVFRLRERRWPTVADLTDAGWDWVREPFHDPWGHQYVLRLADDDNSWVLSLGPDGILSTPDDLTWPVR
jgi:hypothetical protein